MFFGTWNQGNQSALSLWEEDEKRRKKVVADPQKSVATGEVSFREASRITNNRFTTEGFRSTSGNEKTKSYDWEKKYLYDLPRSYGRSYNDKFEKYAKRELGMSRGEAEDFRKYLDAKEKGNLNDWGMNDMLENALAKAKGKVDEDNSPVVPAERTRLDKVFDTLLAGNYFSANFTNNMANKHESFLDAIKHAGKSTLRASNPFGDGSIKDEMTYSKVFDNAGWKPKGKLGKFARGTAGFVADVLLDPTTYATFGTGALIKGGGKASISASKLLKGAETIEGISDASKALMKKGTMSKEVADKIITERNARLGKTLTPEELTKQSEVFQQRFHSLVGTNRKNVGVGVGLKHSPLNPMLKALSFGNKTVNKLADLHVELPGSRQALEMASKLTQADRVYAGARKMIYGTQMSKLFTTKAGLHKLASQDPARIFDFMHMMERSKGLAGDKIGQEKMIREYAKQNLQDLNPSDMKAVVDALQDKTLMAPIKRMVALGSMKQAQQVKDRLVREQSSALEELGKVSDRQAELEDLRNANISEIDGGHEFIKQAEDELIANLHTLDITHISDTETRKKAVEMLVNKSNDLDERFKGLHYPLEPKDKVPPMMDVPEKPTRPYNKKGDAPKEETLTPLPEKPVYPDAPKREDFEKTFVHPVTGKEMPLSDLHQKTFESVEAWKKGAGKPRKPAEADKVINELSEAIYGETGKISLVTYPFAIDNLVKMVENGSSPDFIKQYIKANKHQYDGRARDMYDLVAHKFKYGQDKAYKYKSWDEYYTQRIREIESRVDTKTGEMNKQDWDLYQKLQKDNLERAVMLSKMAEMTPRELKKYRTEYFHEDMMQGVRKLGNNVNFEGSFEWKQRKDGTFYGKDESDKIAGKGESEFLEGQRKKWNDEDFEGTIMKDQRVPTSARQDFTDSIDENGKMEFQNHQDGIKDQRTYELTDEERMIVRGDLTRELTDSGKRAMTPAQFRYIESVEEEIKPLLQEFFKKDFHELSENQRKFLVGMAKQNSLTQVRGGMKAEDKVAVDAIKKEAEKRQELYQEYIHAETVKAQAQIGSPIRFTSDGKEVKGKVISVNREEVHTRPVKTDEKTTLAQGEGVRTEYDVPEYITTYNIQDADGTVHKSVKPKDVVMVNRQKPARILQENSYKSTVDAEFAKAQADYELKIKEIDEAHAKSVEEVNARNEATSQSNAERKAEYEKQKADAKAQYEKDMADYEIKRNAMDETMNEVDSLNKASKAEWAKASRESSQMADDYIRQSDEMLAEFDRLGKEIGGAERKYEGMVNSVKADFEDLKKKKLDNIADLEKHGDELDRQMADLKNVMINGRTYDQTLDRIDELRNAFSSDDAWEDYLELNYSDDIVKWDRANGNKNVGKIVLDTTNHSDKVKRLVKELRGKFNEIADKEILAGRLEQGQKDGLLNEYLTHVATSDGKKFFKDYTLSTNELGETVVKERVKKDTQPSVTQDLGFGEEFNQFAMERKIKKLKMPDGTWVERPTIEQINEVMRPYIKGGGNAFSENIADIYLARALKHNELMYDESYMTEMMRMFGDDVPKDFKPRKGFKTVMNYGLFKRNVEDIAKLKNSLAFEQELAVKKIEAFKRGEKFDTEAFMKQRGSGDYDKFVKEGYDILGFDRDSYRTEGTPLLELTPEQVQKVNDWHEGTLSTLKGKYQKWFDDAEVNRANGYEVGDRAMEQIMKYNDILESLTPLEIKEMHETITGKMNQARKISIAKNQSRILGAYDKFTHWMKVSQTAMLPSFHTRNFLSNQFQNYLAIGNDVFDIGMQKQVMNVLRSKGDTRVLGSMPRLIVKNAKGETTGAIGWDEVLLEAQTRKILDEGFFATEIGANDKSAGLVKGLQHVKVGKKELNLDPTSTENTLAQLGTHVGSGVEGHAKLMQFASHIKNGKTFDEAHDLVNKYLFDYSDLTHFEQNVMKRIFPYYTWLRKNAKLQITQMVEQPGKYRDTAKGINSLESGVDEEDRVETQYLAPFAKDWIQYGGVDKDGKVGIANPNMPFQDISRLPNPLDPKQSIEALLPQINVLPKELIQNPVFGTNHDFFFNDKIAKEGDNKLLKGAEHALTNYAPALQIHDLLTKEDKGRQTLSTAGLKTLKYDYATAKDITIAKYLGKYKDKEPATITKKFMDGLEHKDAITVTQQSASRLLDDYINGEDIGKTKAGIFTPFAKVMKEVGLDKAKNREWVGATLDATHLEKYITGSDFATAKITGVRDGDTIEVELNGKKEAVRFNLIDTPEIGHTKGAKSMAFGDEAHKNMSRLAGKGKDARLVISKDKDAHGRLVAYVYVDGKDLNEEQLESGNAQLRYVNASENPYKYDAYREAQTRAYDKKKGIWSIDGYADNEKGSGYNKRGAYKKYLARGK